MRFPTVILEGKKLPRIIFSIQPPASHGNQEIYSLMKRTYEMGAWCFGLPSARHLESFKELKDSTTDETLIGLCHIEVETGVSFLGKPLHQFEPKVISTIRKELLPSHLTRSILPPSSSSEEGEKHKQIRSELKVRGPETRSKGTKLRTENCKLRTNGVRDADWR